jgi:16S rRNA (cytidine1402-2'-O)-methyltransferase
VAEPLPPPALSTRPLEPGLYVVSTPIGNLRDITLRALDILSRADWILAEDTRQAAKLMATYGLKARIDRYDDHAGERVRHEALRRLAEGARVALVDPGYRLVQEAVAAGHRVYAAPGASAPLAALAVSGLPTDRFLFAGFPPPKTVARKSFLEELAAVRATLIFFEGGPRLAASLKDMAEVLGPRPAVVARELTKLYEESIRGPLDVLAVDPRVAAPKGEIVVLVAPGEARVATEAEVEAALRAALEEARPADAAAEVAKAFGRPRRELYQRALALKSERP